MRIGMISTLSRPVPPNGEGSVELLVSLLTERLVAKGHEVTLFATADSKTSATLCSPVETSYSTDPGKWDWQMYEAFQVREAFRRWSKFDVIHCHSYWYGMLYSDFVPIPSVHSMHIEPGPDFHFLAQRTGRRHLHFCSRYQARDFLAMSNVHIVPHGIEMDQFHVSPPGERGGYLVYLGRFHPDKGTAAAIAAAETAGLPLKLAGPSNAYLREELLPKANPKLVEYVGEVSGAEKAALLSRAEALLYPVERGEPFGLVLIEAMACGLPVVATGRGAVPEIVEHGVTGWIGESQEDLLEGIARTAAFNRNAIRRKALERYSAERMADGLEAIMMEATGLG